jgi:hypothetical protein
MSTSTLNEIPKDYQNFIKKINLDPKNQFPLINLNKKKFIILHEGHYKLFLNENKENKIEYLIEEKKKYINKNNFVKKDFDLNIIDMSNKENEEKINTINEEVGNFVQKIIELKKKTTNELNKKKDNFIKNIKKEIYDETKFKNFVEEENFKKISEHINVIPTPPKITDIYFEQKDRKPETCHYCENKVTGIFTKCDKCNFYICQDCYQILSTTFFHQHPLIIERNNKVEKPFNSKNENEAKELKVREKDKIKKIEIKMKNTGLNDWEKDKIKLALTDETKERYNIDFPDIDLKKKVKPNDTGIFKFEIPWEQIENSKAEVVLKLKHMDFDVLFGDEVKIYISK